MCQANCFTKAPEDPDDPTDDPWDPTDDSSEDPSDSTDEPWKPTAKPTVVPTEPPSNITSTENPSEPTENPLNPTGSPTNEPSEPTEESTENPSDPTGQPTGETSNPSDQPTDSPTGQPTQETTEETKIPAGKPPMKVLRIPLKSPLENHQFPRMSQKNPRAIHQIRQVRPPRQFPTWMRTPPVELIKVCNFCHIRTIVIYTYIAMEILDSSRIVQVICTGTR